MLTKLKQFKDLREQGKKLQGMLANESETANTAGGKVVLTLDGNMQMSALAIDNELLNVNSKEKLQNAIKDAHNDALKKIQRKVAMKMKESGDFNIPGLTG